MTPGSKVSGAYESRWKKPDISDEKELSFENLFRIYGFDQLRFNEFLDKYPPGLIKESVSSIKYEPRLDIRGNLQTLGEADSFGIGRMAVRDTRIPIIIYDNVERGLNFKSFLEVLEHELGHPFDWINGHRLTTSERISLLFEVGERAESEDRFRSPYVEGINIEQVIQRISPEKLKTVSPEQLLKYVKASEYWPEIFDAYFDVHRDFELVKKWVERQSIGK